MKTRGSPDSADSPGAASATMGISCGGVSKVELRSAPACSAAMYITIETALLNGQRILRHGVRVGYGVSAELPLSGRAGWMDELRIDVSEAGRVGVNEDVADPPVRNRDQNRRIWAAVSRDQYGWLAI